MENLIFFFRTGVDDWDSGELHSVHRYGEKDGGRPQTLPRRKPYSYYRNQDQEKTHGK